MNKINLNEVPTYIKHSELYKQLLLKNVKFISSNKKLPLFNCVCINEMKFDNFINLLNTIYFWKLEPEDYPIEFYIYINNNSELVEIYLNKYSNDMTAFLFKFPFDKYFLERVICQTGCCNLINYILENNSQNINEIFSNLCRFGNVKFIEHVLKLFSQININYDADIALCNAAENGNLEIVKFLAKNGADIRTNFDAPLNFASEENHLNVVIFLVEEGADIHADEDYPLCMFCKHGNLEAVEFLIEKGADVHSFNNYPLNESARIKHFKVVELLLKHAQYIECDFYCNCINIAVIKGELNTVKLLIENENKIPLEDDEISEFHYNILKLSIEKEQLDIVKFLLEYSVTTNSKYDEETLTSLLTDNTSKPLKKLIENYIENN